MLKKVLLTLVYSLVYISSITFAIAENNSSKLFSLTSAELITLQEDIEYALGLYHTPDYDQQEAVLTATEEVVESHYSAKGIEVSWAWVNYTYTQEWDFYTLSTHIDYWDVGEKHKSKVYSEVFVENNSYVVYYLSIDEDTLIDRRAELPDNKYSSSLVSVVNEATNTDLSLLTSEELNSLNQSVKKEFAANHQTDFEIENTLLSLIKDYFETQSIEVSWSWFDYTYTREWDLYTLTTPVDYDNVDDAIVYAEAYPFSGQYDLCYLTIDDSVLIDIRDRLPENLFPEKSNTSDANIQSTNKSIASFNVLAPAVTSAPIATPTPTNSPVPIMLQKGSKGDDVKRVQTRLIELGYLNGIADGDYGNQTKTAVEAFQKDYSLEVTGIISNIEISKLFTTQSASQENDVGGNLTVDNCELLANMLYSKNPGNLVGQFMTKYQGRTIEFDGNIAYMANHANYKTRFDILIYFGDYSTTSVTGPNFQFRDVSYNDLELTGWNIPDSVCAGQNYHIVAEVVKYDSSSELVILHPVSMELR